MEVLMFWIVVSEHCGSDGDGLQCKSHSRHPPPLRPNGTDLSQRHIFHYCTGSTITQTVYLAPYGITTQEKRRAGTTSGITEEWKLEGCYPQLF
jgi:hypothetical protein